MVVVVLLILALIPLLGIAWIAISGSLFPQPTVDALFMSLILLTMSGILGTTALFELRRKVFGSGSTASSATPIKTGGPVRTGKVQEVVFFESNVGQPNKSIVTLSADGSSQILVLSGDMRNALPVGQRVHLTLRKEGAQNVLVNVSYA
ncbi:MAG: hypothetical protein JOZ80_16170 [Acidobacteriaceae bacterium]|nr:hypothetical protein [Acidobacteriaceae bacterium]